MSVPCAEKKKKGGVDDVRTKRDEANEIPRGASGNIGKKRLKSPEKKMGGQQAKKEDTIPPLRQRQWASGQKGKKIRQK